MAFSRSETAFRIAAASSFLLRPQKGLIALAGFSRVQAAVHTASVSDQYPTFLHPEYSREDGD